MTLEKTRLAYSTGGPVPNAPKALAAEMERKTKGARIRLEKRASGRVVTVIAEVPGTTAEVEALARQGRMAIDLGPARHQARRLAALAAPATDGGADDLRRRNEALLQAERDLTRPEGLPGRPWFRHLVYAPLPSYAAETLPGVREALLEKDAARASAQAATLAQALRQAADRLEAVGGQ